MNYSSGAHNGSQSSLYVNASCIVIYSHAACQSPYIDHSHGRGYVKAYAAATLSRRKKLGTICVCFVTKQQAHGYRATERPPSCWPGCSAWQWVSELSQVTVYGWWVLQLLFFFIPFVSNKPGFNRVAVNRQSCCILLCVTFFGASWLLVIAPYKYSYLLTCLLTYIWTYKTLASFS